MLIEKVKETIDRHRMLTGGERILVAVSGGVDSVVLFDILKRLADRYSLSLTIAHLDHGLRGEESAQDARFVTELAECEGIPIISERIDLPSSKLWPGLGPEGRAREARRAFLARAAKSAHADVIALGHTANDRAETVLLNLTRGAGPSGLIGVEPVSRPIIRPLIETTRDEIVSYAESRRLRWREDKTNADISFSRNRIRHLVLPELSRINPRVIETICRGGELVADLLSATSHLIAPILERIVKDEKCGMVTLDREGIGELPPEVGRLIIREGIRRARGDLSGIESVHIEEPLRLTRSELPHGSIDLPGVSVRLARDDLVLSQQGFPEKEGFFEEVALGENRFPNLGFSLTLKIVPIDSKEGKPIPDDRTIEMADADLVSFPLHVRSRLPGDRFVPLGMDERVRLKDFLINESVPFFDRDDLPLLCDRERIIWVVGLRLSDEVKLTERTKRVLVMRMERGS